MTAPMGERPDAIISVFRSTSELWCAIDPLIGIEQGLGTKPSDFDEFLTLWIERLQRDVLENAQGQGSDINRWLRAAIGRRDGAAGLGRLARATKQSEDARMWCKALLERKDWSAALTAYEECAEFVESDVDKGNFLDGAALAAQMLGHDDLPGRLEAAWVQSPSLVRLTRWLHSREASREKIRDRATAALRNGSSTTLVGLGLLNLLVGRTEDAAQLLETAPSLGWSRGSHPGHVLFGAFAWLLCREEPGIAVREVTAGLAKSPQYPNSSCHFASTESPDEPSLPCPSVLDVLQRSDLDKRLAESDRQRMLRAMKESAEQRMDGVLREQRRNNYRHAALLVGSILAVDPTSVGWADGQRLRTKRWPAFQAALRDVWPVLNYPKRR